MHNVLWRRQNRQSASRAMPEVNICQAQQEGFRSSLGLAKTRTSRKHGFRWAFSLEQSHASLFDSDRKRRTPELEQRDWVQHEDQGSLWA